MSDHQKNANVSQDSLNQSSVKKTNHANHGEQEIFVPNNVSVSSGAGQMLRAMTQDGAARIFVLNATPIVQKAIQIHHTAPTASAALGRVLTAASMMGTMLKERGNTVTLRFAGDGPLGTVLAVADDLGNVKGSVTHPEVNLPPRSDGKLDVGRAVGHGTLSVIKDLGLKEPWTGSIEIQSGEIAQDITHYFVYSEQTPTLCALGVLVGPNGDCLGAGGVIAQLLPYAPEETAMALENNAPLLNDLSHLFASGKSNEEILALICNGIPYDPFDVLDVDYRCDCSKQRVENVLRGLGKEEINSILAERGAVEVQCRFCGKTYTFDRLECQKLFDIS